MGNIIIEKTSVEDAEEILKLQKTAYISEAEIIDDFTITHYFNQLIYL